MADLAPSKGFLTNKIGPLPTWGWMGLTLGGALAVSTWRKNKAQANAGTNTPLANGQISGQALPSNIVPQFTYVDANTQITNLPPPQVIINTPPTGGRHKHTPAPPQAPPPPVVIPPPHRDPPKPPAWTFDLNNLFSSGDIWNAFHPGKTAPPPAPPPGRYVAVIPWGTNQAAGTPSTLWGIAENVYGAGQGQQWQRIWNAPQNADLRNRRGDPKNIQPGDNFFVPL